MTDPPLILVVDDERPVVAIIARALHGAGFDVALAESGEEALAKIEAGLKPNLIVMDLVMPGLTGSAVMEDLRERGLEFPVLLLTGYVDKVRAETRRQARGVLAKPMVMTELIAEVIRVLREEFGVSKGGV